jgi:hypothetical protein
MLNNYEQALGILDSMLDALVNAMCDLNITNVMVFEDWQVEEKEYLIGLKKEPLEETLHMEYLQKLINLEAAK